MKYALIAALILALMAVPAMAAGPVNLGMESVSAKSTDYCASFNVVGCQEDTISVWKPDTWNTWFGVKYFGQSDTDAHSGSWATAVWYQPPGSCRWNQTGDCGPTGYGNDGSLIQHDVTFSNTSFIMSFWAKKCDFTPVQCEGWRGFWGCNGTQYYGINGTNTGRFMFMLRDLNTSANYTFPVNEATGNWAQYSVSATSINASHLFDIYWGTLAIDSSQAEADCILFDDLAINYTAVSVSPAIAYIADMTLYTNVPYVSYGNCGNHCGTESSQVSRRFDGVPIAYFVENDFYGGSAALCTPDMLTLNYSDGSSLDVLDIADVSHAFDGNHCDLQVKFPLINYTDIVNITIAHNDGSTWHIWFRYAADLSSRETYSDTLTGTETVHGNKGIYPLLSYGHVINATFGHRFYVHNFGSPQGGTSNIIYERRDPTGILQDVSAGSTSIAKAGATLVEAPIGWLTGWNDGDYINVTVISLTNKSYYDWTETRINEADAAVFCTSDCAYDRVWNGLGCVATPTVDGCAPAPVIPPGLGGIDYSDPLMEVTEYPWLSVFLTPILWFMVIVIGAGAAVAYYSHSAHIGMGAMLGLIVIFSAAGIFPFWIALLVGIGIALMLVNMFRTQIFGGGSGGG